MIKKKRLIIIDTSILIYRAYHALPPFRTKKGDLINAIYGFSLIFFRVIRDFQPNYIVAAFDTPKPTFRHTEFKEYKGKRPPMPEELSSQIGRIKELLKEFGIFSLEKEGFEADDIIGTVAALVQKEKMWPEMEIIIITSDLDTLQLVERNINVCTLKRGINDIMLYDEEKVKERDDLLPSNLIDFRALKGDPSDNIPGVAGIGEKTAISLLKDFGSLDNIYHQIEKESDQAAKIKLPIKEKLIKNKESAFFSRSLSIIKKDVPVNFYLEECNFKNYNREKGAGVLKKLELFSLINKMP